MDNFLFINENDRNENHVQLPD